MNININSYLEFRKILINKFLNSKEKEFNYGINNNIEELNKFFKKQLSETEIKILKEYEKIIDEQSYDHFVILENGNKILWKDYLYLLKDTVDFLWDEDREEIKKYLTKEEMQELNVGAIKKKLFRLFLINSTDPVVDIYDFPYNKTKNLIINFDEKTMIKENEENENKE